MAGCGSPPSKKRSTCDVGCAPYTFFQMGTHACQCDHQPNYYQCHGPANIAITAGIAANLRWTAKSRFPPISSHEPTSHIISYLIGKSPDLDRFAGDAHPFEISSTPSISLAKRADLVSFMPKSGNRTTDGQPICTPRNFLQHPIFISLR
jgi:hypothetical protein